MAISNRVFVLPRLEALGGRALATASFDIVFAVVCLVILAPAMVLIALAIRIDSRGPIFFSQTRLGQSGRPFRLHKFRKFHHQQPTAGCAVTIENDPRLTAVGRLLERTKLDELPQLWNILKCEMSVVGPRPETPHFEACFVDAYRGVLEYKPGIFGPAQAMFRNESALYQEGHDPEMFYRAVLFPAKARIDLAYYPSQTLWRDMGWIVRGVLAVAGMSGQPRIGREALTEIKDSPTHAASGGKIVGFSL